MKTGYMNGIFNLIQESKHLIFFEQNRKLQHFFATFSRIFSGDHIL